MSNKNIILDIDNTLLCSFQENEHLIVTLNKLYPGRLDQLIQEGYVVKIQMPNFGGSGGVNVYYAFKRPGLDQFLTFCRKNFKNTFIWSAGHPRYVNEITKILDKDETIFKHIYTSNHVVKYVKDNYRDVIVPLEPGVDMRYCPDIVMTSKPIVKIEYDYPTEVSLKNTVIVDDLACNFELDNSKNGILIPTFKPSVYDAINVNESLLRVLSNDLCLYRLIHYLSDDEFEDIHDVRDYDLGFFQERVKKCSALGLLLVGGSDDEDDKPVGGRGGAEEEESGTDD